MGIDTVVIRFFVARESCRLCMCLQLEKQNFLETVVAKYRVSQEKAVRRTKFDANTFKIEFFMVRSDGASNNFNLYI